MRGKGTFFDRNGNRDCGRSGAGAATGKPLEQRVSGGEITLVVDLAQPGRVHLGNPVLVDVQ